MVSRLLLTLIAALGMIGTSAAEAELPADANSAASSRSKKYEPEEYRLSNGDVVEFSVRGFPELRQKAIVELDGEVSLPLAGRVKVLGLSISAAQDLIKKLTVPRPLQQRFPDGRETYVALSPDDVLVKIAEYRPIYVIGDVAKPGEIPFRPGMTVRQAVALGGGYDIMRYRLVNPFMESADLKGQFESLWTEAARARLRLKRIEAELEGKTELDPAIVQDVPLNKAYLQEVVKTEVETLARRLADNAKEIEHIKGLIELNLAKVDTLRKQLTAEMQGSEVDQQELEQMKDAQRRGNLPLMRLMEIRRIQLTNSTRVLQTRVQFDQAERDLAEARRSLERHLSNYRTTLLADRQDQLTVYNGLLAKIAASSEKLEHTSLLKSRLVRGRGGRVTIAIHRSLLDGKQSLAGTEDTELYPGDTVDLTLESEREVDEAIRRGLSLSAPGAPLPSAMARPAEGAGQAPRGGNADRK